MNTLYYLIYYQVSNNENCVMLLEATTLSSRCHGSGMTITVSFGFVTFML